MSIDLGTFVKGERHILQEKIHFSVILYAQARSAVRLYGKPSQAFVFYAGASGPQAFAHDIIGYV